ncbi:hypothetical protein COSO111634_27010 [Corallococcus soli]
MMLTSLTNSTDRGVPRVPTPGSFTDRPSTTYWLSGELLPLMLTP